MLNIFPFLTKARVVRRIEMPSFLSSLSRAFLVQYVSLRVNACPIFFFFPAVVLLHSFHLLDGLVTTTEQCGALGAVQCAHSRVLKRR